MQKKADAIIKVYNDMSFSAEEWRIIAFHVRNGARAGIMENILAFHDGLMYYHNSPHFTNQNQLQFDLGAFDGIS
jgi:hypothetical protein